MNKKLNSGVDGFVNLAIVLTIALPIGVLWIWVDPVNRGFYCGDESLSYPLRKDTITNTVLCVVCIGVPIVLISSMEWFFPPSGPANNIKKVKVKKIYYTIIDGVFGAAVTVLLTVIAKYTIGRLR